MKANACDAEEVPAMCVSDLRGREEERRVTEAENRPHLEMQSGGGGMNGQAIAIACPETEFSRLHNRFCERRKLEIDRTAATHAVIKIRPDGSFAGIVGTVCTGCLFIKNELSTKG